MALHLKNPSRKNLLFISLFLWLLLPVQPLGLVPLTIPKASGVENNPFGTVNNSYGPISFTVTGAKLLSSDTSDTNHLTYNLLVPSGSTINIKATAQSTPSRNASGVTFRFDLKYADVEKEIYTNKTSTTFSAAISTIRERVNNTYINMVRLSYTVVGCPSKGCPKYVYTTTIMELNIYPVPKITVNSNATGTVIIPALSKSHNTLYNYTCVKLFGKVWPIDFQTVHSTGWGSRVYVNGLDGAGWAGGGSYVRVSEDGSWANEYCFAPHELEAHGVDISRPINYTFVEIVSYEFPKEFARQRTSNASVTVFATVLNETTSSTTTTTTSTSLTRTNNTNQQLTGVVKDALGRPLRGVDVQLFWSSSKSRDLKSFRPLSEVTYTDYLGNFMIRGKKINSTMTGWGFIQVTLQTDYFVVKDNTTGTGTPYPTPYSLPPARFDYPNNFFTVSSSSDLRQDIVLTNSEPPTWASTDPSLGNYQHAGSLGVIYVNTFNAVSFYTDQLKFHGFYGHQIPIVGFGKSKSSFFMPAANPYIFISSINSEKLNDISNREYHEFAHYVMYLVFGRDYDISNQGGNRNHNGFMNPNSKDSWKEGWAEFFGQANWNYAHNIEDPNSYNAWYEISDTYTRNLNNVEPVNRTYTVLGHKNYVNNAEEHAVSNILWALYSPKDDIDGAKTQLSITNIWNIITGTYMLCQNIYASPATCRQTSERHIETLTDFFTLLVTPTVYQKYGINQTQIEKLALAFHVLEVQPDSSITWGIANPSGGPKPSDLVRKDRRDDFAPPYEEITVKSNPQSLPYQLTIAISYAAPYEKDGTTIYANITKAEQTVSLWLPTSKLYSTTATLSASKPGYQTITIASVNSTAYDNPRSNESLLETPLVSLQQSGSPSSNQPSNPSEPLQITSLIPFVAAGVIVLLVIIGIRKVFKRSHASPQH